MIAIKGLLGLSAVAVAVAGAMTARTAAAVYQRRRASRVFDGDGRWCDQISTPIEFGVIHQIERETALHPH